MRAGLPNPKGFPGAIRFIVANSGVRNKTWPASAMHEVNIVGNINSHYTKSFSFFSLPFRFHYRFLGIFRHRRLYAGSRSCIPFISHSNVFRCYSRNIPTANAAQFSVNVARQ